MFSKLLLALILALVAFFTLMGFKRLFSIFAGSSSCGCSSGKKPPKKSCCCGKEHKDGKEGQNLKALEEQK